MGRKGSAGDTSSGTEDPEERNRHRLMRQKAQSRKTFRFRKSRRGAGFLTKDKDKDDSGSDVEMQALRQCSFPEEDGISSTERPSTRASKEIKDEDANIVEAVDAGNEEISFEVPTPDETCKLLGDAAAMDAEKS